MKALLPAEWLPISMTVIFLRGGSKGRPIEDPKSTRPKKKKNLSQTEAIKILCLLQKLSSYEKYMYHEQQNKCYPPPKGFYLPISKLHTILAVANLLAHNNITIKLLCASKFGIAKIECSF